MRLTAIRTRSRLLFLLALLALEGGDRAVAGHVACGVPLTTDTTLHSDLVCAGGSDG